MSSFQRISACPFPLSMEECDFDKIDFCNLEYSVPQIRTAVFLCIQMLACRERMMSAMDI